MSRVTFFCDSFGPKLATQAGSKTKKNVGVAFLDLKLCAQLSKKKIILNSALGKSFLNLVSESFCLGKQKISWRVSAKIVRKVSSSSNLVQT